MKTVWKFPIEPNSAQGDVYRMTVNAPEDAKPICVMNQGGEICVWMEVTPDAPKKKLTLFSIGTGFGAIHPEARYIGSVMQGHYVWHIYW